MKKESFINKSPPNNIKINNNINIKKTKYMKHFLTVRRNIESCSIIEEREYYFDDENKEVIEYFSYINIDDLKYISIKDNNKKIKAHSFVINLEEIIKHPGVIYQDVDFIKRYCLDVLDGVLGQH